MSDIELNVYGEGNRVEEAKGQANQQSQIINFNGIKFFNNGEATVMQEEPLSDMVVKRNKNFLEFYEIL